MSLFRKIDKVLAAFGNIRAMERTHVDTYTENLIQNIPGTKVAESSQGQLFFHFKHLAGYDFLEVVILSRMNIKTLKGGTLVFGSNKELTISSDTQEIESDFSNVSNRWMTKVSFIVDKKEKTNIKNKAFDQIHFTYKKKTLSFFGLKN